jgi:methyl-accepting chemotaxis protein
MLDRILSPVVKDEEVIVKAKALNLLALVIAAVILVYIVVTLLTAPAELPISVVLVLVLAIVVSLFCFRLGKRGRVQPAGYILFVGLFLAISLYSLTPTLTISDLTMAPFLYIVVILPVGYVIHPRLSLIAATLAVLYTVGLFLLLPPPAYAAYENKANYWSNAGLAFALFYVLSAIAWVFSQGIGQTLQRARQQNRELEQITQELEAKQQLQAATGRQVLDLAERLAQYSARQARGSSRQAAAVAQVSASIEELKQSAQEIAQNANLVDQAAQRTLKGAQEGQDIIRINGEAMSVIHAKAQQGVQHATDLSERLKEVNRVATIISSIASQIQMVAFNATLEAAEAGEAGRRFGVVAAEVKDLASDSLKEAKQVAQIVHKVHEVGEAVVVLSSDQAQAVETGDAAMSQSCAANQAIIDLATEMAKLAAQIQRTTAQQQEADEQVAASMGEIKAVVDRWVVSSYQMDEMVSNLQSLATQLA